MALWYIGKDTDKLNAYDWWKQTTQMEMKSLHVMKFMEMPAFWLHDVTRRLSHNQLNPYYAVTLKQFKVIVSS